MELRKQISQWDNNSTMEDLDKAIDRIHPTQLMDMYFRTSGYTQDPTKQNRKYMQLPNGNWDRKKIDLIKKALKNVAYIPNSAGTQIVTLGCDMFEITEVANQYAKVLLKEYRGKDLKMPQDVLNAKVSVYLAHFMKFNYELRFESLLTEEEKAHEKENFDVILAPAPGPNETIVAIYDVTNKPYMAFGLNFVDHPDGGEVDVDHK